MAKKRSKTTAARPARTVSVRRPQPVIRASFDAARTTDENSRHWANADALSPVSALTSEVRAKLRNRCRYEVANNSYAKGIGLTIANDTIGTGPQLQMLTPDPALNRAIETAYWLWSQEIRLAQKLRMQRFARYDSGESFAIQATNPGLDSPVKLDIWILESEQIGDPTFDPDPSGDDGIFYDAFGNPIAYRMLKTHPGDTGAWVMDPTAYEDLPARFVDHNFRPDRPGQRRGIPDITPAVQLFAELRRYCAAVIAAAETAADLALVLQTSSLPEDSEGTVEATAFETVELTRRMATTLPAGYQLSQTKPEQPTTVYDAFVATKLKEIARCVNVPYTIAAQDSSVSNMSAAYVDRQTYAHERRMERVELERPLERWLDRWLTEAARIPGYLPPLPPDLPHQWMWPTLGHHADPQKVANAATTELKAGLTTIPQEYARRGLDWEEQQSSAAKALGVSVDEYRRMLRDNLFPPQVTSSESEQTDEDEE